MTDTATETATIPAGQMTITDMPWRDPEVIPPENLPYDDGDKMESPWHADNLALLKAGYIASQGGMRDTYYIGGNMFVYYSLKQLKNQDFKGPDVFIVKDVDGTRERLYWASWEEDGRLPDVIIELLSQRTEHNDLGAKKQLYERTFHTMEYFCVDLGVERLMGWRLHGRHYQEIAPDERGWLWSEELGLWLGAWHGRYMGREHTWLRFYHADGSLVLLPDEAEKQRADNEKQRADTLEDEVTRLKAELARLQGEAGA
jgi:hypothetical protein